LGCCGKMFRREALYAGTPVSAAFVGILGHADAVSRSECIKRLPEGVDTQENTMKKIAAFNLVVASRIAARRQIGSHLMNLLFDKVIVIGQPSRCRG